MTFTLLDAIRKLGASAFFFLRRLGILGLFLAKAVLYCFIPPLKFRLILKRIHFIGLQSMLLIILTGAFTGMVLGLQGYYTLSRFGSGAYLGSMVALSLVKEMGPVISGLMVTGRAGSAIAAEIGIMRISDQIDAIELMGLQPFRYLVVPNLIAAIISMPLLTAIFDVVGIFGGYLVGVKLLGTAVGTYFGEMRAVMNMDHIMEGIYKSFSFGVIISWIGCYKGYYTGTWGWGAEGVSKSTTQAVVLSAVLILMWDYFMTSILF